MYVYDEWKRSMWRKGIEIAHFFPLSVSRRKLTNDEVDKRQRIERNHFHRPLFLIIHAYRKKDEKNQTT